MNILVINKYYSPNLVGGTEVSIKLLSEIMAKNGHNVYVYTLDGEKDGRVEETINGVNVIRRYSRAAYEKFKNNKRTFLIQLNDYFNFYINVRSLYDIREIIESKKINIIHTNNCIDISYQVWKYAFRHNIPLCHTLRDYWLLDPRAEIGRSNSFIVGVHRLFYRRYANKYVSFITAPSQRTLDIYERYHYFKSAKRIKIVNCVEIDSKQIKIVKAEKMKRDREKIVFLYVGALEKNKGFDLLLETYCNNKDINSELCICGDGSLKCLMDKVADSDNRIIYKGKLTKEKLAEEYWRADVLVVPSVWEEPFGRVLIEGAKYANCIICSDVGGMAEIMEQLKCGLMFKAGDKKEFEKVLKKINDRNQIKAFLHHINDSIEYYSLERQYKSFSQLYENVIKDTTLTKKVY